MNDFDRKIGGGVLLLAVLLGLLFPVQPQAEPEQEMVQLIQALKKDPRGPYQAIKWFCPDGQTLPARERCPMPGGLQHGMLKPRISKLEQERQVYLDMVLAGVPHEKIWDASGQHSRIKQYAVIHYLFLADEGWIYRNARYYRGAIQVEDETAWGNGFLTWLLAEPAVLTQQFFLAREAFRVVPHPGGDQNRLQTIRAVSKTLSDQIPEFMDLRVKLHGQPDPGDRSKVRAFVEASKSTLDENQTLLFKELMDNLEAFYAAANAVNLKTFMSGRIAQIPQLAESIKILGQSMDRVRESGSLSSMADPNACRTMADLLLEIRSVMPSVRPDIRPGLMNFSLELEKVLFTAIATWYPQTLADLMEKCRILTKAAAGCGYLEQWEWSTAEAYGFMDAGLNNPDNTLDFKNFDLKVEQIRRMVDWGSLMIRSTYLPEITRYAQFEPLAQGFVDDRIRSSILLPMGEAVGRLTRFAQTTAGVSHQLPPGVEPQGVRGLNPGLAHGILEVVTDDMALPVMDSKKIYAFKTVPGELKPVAGMLTVSQGNLVSHVQLLARNLGIPNAVITSEDLDRLKTFSGQKMFYAVSQKGSVVLKPDSRLTDPERALVQGRKRSEDLFRVPVEKIDLTQADLIPLSRIRAQDSGRICGPKAANLGQLKVLFPDRVGEGIVIPFGMFRRHMDQVMPGLTISYWQFLKQTLSNPSTGDTQLMASLSRLQAAIETMPFLPGFEAAVADMFDAAFGHALGKVPVFIRSDTNMEDIPNFTGAGLNLTVFNVVNREKLFKGIRDVWASPYSERSYLWRQKYLENPENVFPSILLLPSVNVDKSGVVITHGIVSHAPDDITVAFNRGAGGAVDGQTAETYLLKGPDTDLLLYPARETMCTRLPATGGTEKQFLVFDQPVLTGQDRSEIRELVKTVRRVLPDTPGIEGQGPFDIELGFINGSMRLFQVRPFVENRRAGALNYLIRLDENRSGPATVLTGQTRLPDIKE